MMFNIPMEQRNRSGAPTEAEIRLDELFRVYREACPEPEGGVNFMPELWAKIEARQVSGNLFGRMARALVTVALAATVILGLMISTEGQQTSSFNGTYLEAVSADQVSSLEPLTLERISEMEHQ